THTHTHTHTRTHTHTHTNKHPHKHLSVYISIRPLRCRNTQLQKYSHLCTDSVHTHTQVSGHLCHSSSSYSRGFATKLATCNIRSGIAPLCLFVSRCWCVCVCVKRERERELEYNAC